MINERAQGAKPEKKKELGKLSGYLIANREGLVDYRDRIQDTDEDARGLGSVEGNIDKKVADRLSKRGMRWSKEGADAIGKVLELRANELLTDRIGSRGRDVTSTVAREALSAADLARTRLREDPEAWLEAHMPALYGPDGSKPWARVLRSISGLSEAV